MFYTLSSRTDPILLTATLNEVDHTMEVDTGATLLGMNEATYHSFWSNNNPQFMSCSSQLKTYTGEQIKFKGAIPVNVQYIQEPRSPIEYCSGQWFRSQFIRTWLAQSHSLGLVIPQIYSCNPITKMLSGHWLLSFHVQGWTWAHQGNPGSIWGRCKCPAQVLLCLSSTLCYPIQS